MKEQSDKYEGVDFDRLARIRLLTSALESIKKSSIVDFQTSLEWGQWCRNLAIETLGDKSPAIEALDRQAFLEREQRLTDGEAW